MANRPWRIDLPDFVMQTNLTPDECVQRIRSHSVLFTYDDRPAQIPPLVTMGRKVPLLGEVGPQGFCLTPDLMSSSDTVWYTGMFDTRHGRTLLTMRPAIHRPWLYLGCAVVPVIMLVSVVVATGVFWIMGSPIAGWVELVRMLAFSSMGVGLSLIAISRMRQQRSDLPERAGEFAATIAGWIDAERVDEVQPS
jgi:hypothetical protein